MIRIMVMIRIMTYETLVNSEKYIGLDVHQATISVAVGQCGFDFRPRGRPAIILIAWCNLYRGNSEIGSRF